MISCGPDQKLVYQSNIKSHSTFIIFGCRCLQELYGAAHSMWQVWGREKTHRVPRRSVVESLRRDWLDSSLPGRLRQEWSYSSRQSKHFRHDRVDCMFQGWSLCGNILLELYRVYTSTSRVSWHWWAELLSQQWESESSPTEEVCGPWLLQGVEGGLDWWWRRLDLIWLQLLIGWSL